MEAATNLARRFRWKQITAAGVVVIALLASIAVLDRGEGDSVQAEPAATPTAQAGSTVESVTSIAPPSPDADGDYRDVTFEQAQMIVPFDVVMPEELPEGLVAPDIVAEEAVRIEGLVTRPDAKMYTVTSSFILTDDATTGQAIKYIQTNRMMENPPWGEISLIELGGKEVNRAIISGMGGPTTAIYWWQVDGVYSQVTAEIDDQLTIDVVEQLVASIQLASSVR